MTFIRSSAQAQRYAAQVIVSGSIIEAKWKCSKYETHFRPKYDSE
jgi:hypothetical protein